MQVHQLLRVEYGASALHPRIPNAPRMSPLLEPEPARAPILNPNHWVDAYADALFRYALTRLRRRQDAEDAVQDTLLAALQGHREFRGESAELTWLIGILRNKVIDRIRLASREVMIAVESMEDWCGPTDRWLHAPKQWSGDPSRLVENGEFWDQIRTCFAGLPERQAQVFALRTFDELEADEICQQTGLTTTNLWVLLHRARTGLRACLEGSCFTHRARPTACERCCRR